MSSGCCWHWCAKKNMPALLLKRVPLQGKLPPCHAALLRRRWTAASGKWAVVDRARLTVGTDALNFEVQDIVVPSDTQAGAVFLFGFLVYECEVRKVWCLPRRPGLLACHTGAEPSHGGATGLSLWCAAGPGAFASVAHRCAFILKRPTSVLACRMAPGRSTARARGSSACSGALAAAPAWGVCSMHCEDECRTCAQRALLRRYGDKVTSRGSAAACIAAVLLLPFAFEGTMPSATRSLCCAPSLERASPLACSLRAWQPATT